MKIPVISTLLQYFRIFYGYSGRNIYYLAFFVFFAGLSESLGISLILPILNFEKNAGERDPLSAGVYDFFAFIGVDPSLSNLLFLMVFVFTIKGLCTFIQESLSAYITTSLLKKIRIDLFLKYSKMQYSHYINTNIGYLNNVITTETDRAVGGLGKYIEVLTTIIFIAIYVGYALVLNASMTLIVLLSCFSIFLLLRILTRKSRELSLLISHTNAEIQSTLIQTIHSFKYLKATNGFSKLLIQINKKIDKNRAYRFKNKMLAAIPKALLEPATAIFLAFFVYFQVIQRGEGVAEILILLIFFYKAFTRVFTFQTVWQKFNANIGGIEVLRKITEELKVNTEKFGAEKVKGSGNCLQLKKVDFLFGTKKVLSNINISIFENKTIGIIGESGSGKTTLLDILLGLLVPQAGSATIQGKNFRSVDLLTLRNKIGYITQEPAIFNDTIANNISLWQCSYEESSGRERIEKAVELANCTKFIGETEEGFRTKVGDNGVKLSGGQRQRIAIAREIFKNPEILFFDEATSALDTESEMVIQESIKKMAGQRTIVIVAHRLSTVKNCDYIYVVDNGQIIEHGSYQGLYDNSKSIFSKMCSLQNV